MSVLVAGLVAGVGAVVARRIQREQRRALDGLREALAQERQSRERIERDLVAREQQVRERYDDRTRQMDGNLDELCAHVLPIWSGQIEMARAHTEESVSGLMGRLLALHSRASSVSSRTRLLAGDVRRLLVAAASAGTLAEIAALADELEIEAAALDADVAGALMGLQFQDRADQILSNVRSDQIRLQQQLLGRDQAASTVALDVDAWLAGLSRTYTMLEQRAVHHGQPDARAAAQAGEIEFF